ncbi:hypothetical protein [Arenimonas terrae]|uniref:DUF4852 domain-containing protein n=1 Tax=Arenimonas terrae TaxID=2546226 RepID=A0A5C4RPY9_9GAMM|nr:hypothetical protein [Arenimonas terrae]TNJ33015.1 hypothetical protein E1B00_11920 [Arenimonas terrae]
MSVSDRSVWLRIALTAALASLLVACGNDAPVAADNAGDAAAPVAGQDAPAATPAPAPRANEGKAAAPAGTVATAAPVLGSRVLGHPDDLQMVMLGYRLQGRVPPLTEWAAEQPRVKYGNEFERADLLAQESARLQDIYDATADIGRLRLNVNARLSEYDAGRGGFYLNAYLPGSRFDFAVQPAPYPVREERVTLAVDDRGELNFWSVEVATAQQALARNDNLREVLLDSELQITGVSHRSEGVVIEVELLGYAILTTHYDQRLRLGEVRFDQ